MNADYAAHARVSARASLERMAGRDITRFTEFVIGWLVRSLTLDQLTDLVVQLDAEFQSWTDNSGAVVELPDTQGDWLDSGSGPGYYRKPQDNPDDRD